MGKITILLLLSTVLLGCASNSGSTTNEEFKEIETLKLAEAPLALEEKNELFSIIFEAIHDSSPFVASPHPQRRSERSSHNSGSRIAYLGGTNMDYQYDFTINNDNQVVREIMSREWHGKQERIRDCLLCLDNGFNEYVDELLEESVKTYNKVLTQPDSAVQQKKIMEAELTSALERINVDVHASSVYPAQLSKQIKDGLRLNMVSGELKYSKGAGLELVEPYIEVSIQLPPSYQRIKNIKYDYSPYRLTAGDEYQVDVQVKSAVYDMLPVVFEAKDQNIQAVIDNGVLKVTNKTNNFINIESFTVYWGENADTIKDLELSIPPQAISSKSLRDQFDVYDAYKYPRYYNSDRYVDVESVGSRFNFGVAISYFNIDTNKRNTLYQKNVYSRADLD
ncbi:hypothetical protein LYZ37_12765 [Vibrio tubiashii]|uniref:hypothetical protein n=1 Tax=Vibrio tubiashii TaxID=29498 RepID=UPI00234E7F06|nr:hypothetical protein [Vibrio tubiashii]WCP66708.1 hypothetical protein LYZ37_12765 [Vibrio tubiashii]